MDPSSLGKRAPPFSHWGVSEAGQASRDAPTHPSVPGFPRRPSPRLLGVRKAGVPFPCGPRRPLCIARELGTGGHRGPLVLSQGHAWGRVETLRGIWLVTGIGEPWHVREKLRLLTVRQCVAPG